MNTVTPIIGGPRNNLVTKYSALNRALAKKATASSPRPKVAGRAEVTEQGGKQYVTFSFPLETVMSIEPKITRNEKTGKEYETYSFIPEAGSLRLSGESVGIPDEYGVDVDFSAGYLAWRLVKSGDDAIEVVPE